MNPVHAIASVLLVGMGYSVWRGFNPRKSEKPGPHNGWRNQEHAARPRETTAGEGWAIPPHQSAMSDDGGDGK